MTTDFNATNTSQFDRHNKAQVDNKNGSDKTLSPWLGKVKFSKSIKN